MFVSFRSYYTHAFCSTLLPGHTAMLHILWLRLPYLSGACSIAFRCDHPFSGNAACSLWCGYYIVYCAIPDRDPSFVNTMLLLSGTLSLLPERGMSHTRSRHTITLHFHCFLYLCILLR